MTCTQSTESFVVVKTRMKYSSTILMKYSIIILLFAFAACGHGGDRPDVSGVAVGEIHIERFDTAFFSLDSNNIIPGLHRLNQSYPWFTADFVGNILGAGPLS